MPVKSKKQYGLMQAAAHGNLRGVGPSPAVAKEMIAKTPATKRKKFAAGLRRRKKRQESVVGY